MVVQFKQLLTALCLAMFFWVLIFSCAEEHKTDTPGGSGEQPGDRAVIYQLVVRTFSNITATNQTDGDLYTNGVGKFAQIDDTALAALAELQVTHIWLTGVLQQATDTDYSFLDPPQPADDPDILKGRAGSFFAVKDYFDVCPDYALDPQNRLSEFVDLVDRIHEAGMKAIIDFVPNHVARTYDSDVKPELNFGAEDNASVFFTPQNNFFYLVDPPGQVLSIPEPTNWPRPSGADGTVETEDNDGNPPGDVPKATGNNQTSAILSEFDWYETVKLNYGFDFITGETYYEPIPDTWTKMDEVLAYWQGKGVDGFRCDFAHWVPVEAWQYLIDNARARDPQVYFFAEAYESGDGPPGFSLTNLIKVGFDAVYDDQTYDTVKGIFCCGKWANDIDDVLSDDYLTAHLLHYAENHDERRIASPVKSGESPDSSGFGSFQAGVPVAGLLFLLGPGPILIYNGQEVGEEGAGVEGFGGEDGRTSIFDYWTMPQMAKWVNGYLYDGGGLDTARIALRQWYATVLSLAGEPGFADGKFYSIQSFNKDNWRYSSGQYVYSFLRYDNDSGDAYLVVANFASDVSHSFDLLIPAEAVTFLGHDPEEGSLSFQDVFEPEKASVVVETKRVSDKGIEITLSPYELSVYQITGD